MKFIMTCRTYGDKLHLFEDSLSIIAKVVCIKSTCFRTKEVLKKCRVGKLQLGKLGNIQGPAFHG